MKRFFHTSSKRMVFTTESLRFYSSYFEGTHLRQFYEVRQDSRLTDTLGEIETLRDEIQVKQSQANGNLQTAIHDKLRYLWTFNSNAIEGSRLSLGDTIFFLQEGLTVGGKPLKDFLDAHNHSEAIDYLYDVIRQTYPIDAHFLCSLNALLLKGVETIPARDATGRSYQKRLIAGQYKTEPNYVIQPDGTIHEYVQPHLVQTEVEGLCSWLSLNPEKYHPVVLSSIAHYNHVRIHPFPDGNGRGSRLLMNLILMREKYIPAVIEVTKRKEYIASLKAGDKGNLLPFTQFVADSVKKTHVQVLDEINRYLSEKTASPSMKN